MSLMRTKKEEIARGIKFGGIQAKDELVVRAGNKVLPINESTTPRFPNPSPDVKKEKGNRTKTVSRMIELLRWAAAAKSEKGGKYIARKVRIYASNTVLFNCWYPGQLMCASIDFRGPTDVHLYDFRGPSITLYAPQPISLGSKVSQFRNRTTLKSIQDVDQMTNESPKISFRWELESCSTFSSALSISSTNRNDQNVNVEIHSNPDGNSSLVTLRSGSWITTDSDCKSLGLSNYIFPHN
ncbi:hypothetical protein OSB04_023190 [Centaurea solstitialis]|uniref:Uncharacterized protein n=1 Tax=Centaurea solstitialis TaxID=347529 RepID=A0AA38SR71_9ASTR|nr:hypothetical protein OSB04_023190 [Centaurea solstitialis]